jgi:hypothetical protein
MNPLNSAKYFTQPEAELIELAPGLKVTQGFLSTFPIFEIPALIEGHRDMLEGRLVPYTEVLKILAKDAKQRGLDSESTSRL